MPGMLMNDLREPEDEERIVPVVVDVVEVRVPIGIVAVQHDLVHVPVGITPDSTFCTKAIHTTASRMFSELYFMRSQYAHQLSYQVVHVLEMRDDTRALALRSYSSDNIPHISDFDRLKP
jgi:hypothetical protein